MIYIYIYTYISKFYTQWVLFGVRSHEYIVQVILILHNYMQFFVFVSGEVIPLWIVSMSHLHTVLQIKPLENWPEILACVSSWTIIIKYNNIIVLDMYLRNDTPSYYK